VTEPKWHGGERVAAEIAEATGSIGYLAEHGALAGVAQVIRERRRQVEAKGHTVEADPEKAAGRTGAARPKTRNPIPEVKLADKEILTTEEVAALLSDVSVRTLEDWRRQGLGPDFIAISAKMVRYRREAVDRWLDSLERKTRAQGNPLSEQEQPYLGHSPRDPSRRPGKSRTISA